MTKFNIPKRRGRRLWKLVNPVFLIVLLLALTLLTATPVNALPKVQSGTLTTAISLSDYKPGATSNYTIYFMLGTDWTPDRNMMINFSYPFGGKSGEFGLTNPQYIDAASATGTPEALDDIGYTFYTSGGYMDKSILIISRSSGGTLPAGTTVILHFQGVTNPAAGNYTVNFSNGLDSGSCTLRFSLLPKLPPSIAYSVVGDGSISAQNPYTYSSVPAGFCAMGTIVELYPSAADGWYWDYWTGDVSGGSSGDLFKHAIVVDQTSIGAVFSNTVHVDVSWNTEGGSVSPGPGTYAFNSTQTFTATPNPGWHFVEWIGWQHVSCNPIAIPIDLSFAKSAARNVQAVFAPNKVTFNISENGSGTVNIYPDKTTFSETKETVQLEAIANVSDGWRFDRWEYSVVSGWLAPDLYGYDKYTSTENPLVFTVDTTGSYYPNTADYLRDGPVNVTAVFIQPETYKVDVSRRGTGTGSVSANPGLDNLPGTEVTLTAIPLEGKATFSHWECDDITISVPTANPLTFTMPARNLDVLYYFIGNDFTLTTGANPPEGGSVTLDPPGGTYPYGTGVELTATANPGWHLTGWSGTEFYDDIVDNTINTTIYEDRIVTANFAPDPYFINTPAGEEVSVPLLDEATSTAPVTVIFSEVTESGVTTLSISQEGPDSKAGFSFGDPPVFYYIETTAAFTGTARVCLTHDGLTDAHRLLHFENGAWVDVTTAVDLLNGTICGDVASFSPFVVATIIKADQAISFGPLADKTYGDVPFEVSAESSSGLPVSFTIKSGPAGISGNTVTITGVGTVVIAALQAGNDYYYAAPDVEQSFNVGKANAVITLDAAALNQSYNSSPKIVTATTDPSGLSYNITFDGLSIAPVNAGSYAVVVTVDDINYQGFTSGTLTVTPLGITGSFTADDKVYDGTIDAEVVGRFLTGVLTGNDVSLVGGTAAFSDKNVGDNKIVTLTGATLSGVDASNYSLTSVATATADITARPITVTADPQTKVYGEADPALTYQVTCGSLAAGDSFSGALSRVSGENVGAYVITQGTLTAGPNYTINFVPADFSITPKAASVTPNDAGKTYGDADPTLNGTLSGFLAADGVSATYSRTAGESVGIYTISAALSPSKALDNYNITYNTAAFTIVYNYSNVLQPININGSSVFRLGSTVPVKFQLRDANGNFVANAAAGIYLSQLINGEFGTEEKGVSTSAATTGYLFRYDSKDKQYIFNLSTKGLSIGTWRIRIDLGDGTTNTVNIGLR